MDRLGGLGGCPNADASLIPETENVGDKIMSCSAGRPSTALVDTERRVFGAGMLLGVLGLCRGVFAEAGASFCEGVCGRDGDRNVGKGGGT